MDRITFYKQALKKELYKNKAWIISLFTIQDDSRTKPFPYQIKIKPDGIYYLNESLAEIKFTDKPSLSEPLLQLNTLIPLIPGDIPNNREEVTTAAGNLLANWILFVYPFYDKYPYHNKQIKVGKIETEIAANLHDNIPLEERNPRHFYVDEYLKFVQAYSDFISGLSLLTTATVSAKTIIPAPGINEYKEKLFKEAGDDINDPIILKEIEDKLMAYAEEYIGDDPSKDKFFSGKVKNIAYKKLFLTYGVDNSFDPNDDKIPVQSSLSQGLELTPESFTTYVNGLRVASYGRAKDTVLGGVVSKVLSRIMNTFSVSDDDCGVEYGLKRVVYKDMVNYFIGSQIKQAATWKTLESSQEIESLIGQEVEVRSPGLCLKSGDTVCKECAGRNLAMNKNGLISAGLEISNIILNASMKGMHSVGLIELSNMDVDRTFS